jgi:hypothetical protein
MGSWRREVEMRTEERLRWEMRGWVRVVGGARLVRFVVSIVEGSDSSSIGELVEGEVVLVSGWIVLVPIEDAVGEGGEGCAIFAGWLA